MTLPGYCLHFVKLPGKVGGGGWGMSKHRPPLYRKQSKASEVIAKDFLVYAYEWMGMLPFSVEMKNADQIII